MAEAVETGTAPARSRKPGRYVISNITSLYVSSPGILDEPLELSAGLMNI